MRPYGSFVSGLFSPEGDLDMALDGFLDYKCVCDHDFPFMKSESSQHSSGICSMQLCTLRLKSL